MNKPVFDSMYMIKSKKFSASDSKKGKNLEAILNNSMGFSKEKEIDKLKNSNQMTESN